MENFCISLASYRKVSLYFIFVYISVCQVCVCVGGVGAHERGIKEVLGSLEIELQVCRCHSVLLLRVGTSRQEPGEAM